MRKRQPGQGRLILPYADLIMEMKGSDWEETPDGELQEHIARAAERRRIRREQSAGPLQSAGAKMGAEECAELYSLLSQAVFRCTGLKLFDTQLAAALAMENGKIVQLPTGEGKTLAAAVTAAARALGGEKVHIFVYNDYLAERDWRANQVFYRYCGLTSACIVQKSNKRERRLGYGADVLYITAREAGFDYLKNFLCMEQEEWVVIPTSCGIVDEADSILIDEARIPLVLAGSMPERDREESAQTTEDGPVKLAWRAAGRMGPAEVETDAAGARVWLTAKGISLAESLLGIDNLYAEENAGMHSAMMAALEAKYLLERGRDYLVTEEGVRLVDGLTGRMAESRRYPELLHRAAEEKEGIGAAASLAIYNSIPLQFFLKQYDMLAGMTGTATGCEKELKTMYGLDTILLSPHVPCIRVDEPDFFVSTEAEKEGAVVQEVRRAYQRRQPVLLGTQSVAESERYAELLSAAGVPNFLLNAARADREAELIARAGEPGRVTVSTNMAGRGVDIRLGGPEGTDRTGGADRRGDVAEAPDHVEGGKRAEARAAGGLYVIGCGLAANRRVENQLRGRAGRQGDPGKSRFFISLDEPIFQTEYARKLFRRGKSPKLARELQRAGEGSDAEKRYMLERYAAILEVQRRRITHWRREVLTGERQPGFLQAEEPELFERYAADLGWATVEKAERQLALYFCNRCWSDYLAVMENVRPGVHLALIGGENPLDSYNKTAVRAFAEMEEDIRACVIAGMKSCRITEQGIDLEKEGLGGSAVTWTYAVDENPGQFSGLPLILRRP
ncbi:preprotein translocase subunit SecA [Bacilliculturomica massiliensis]|uniref:preprotein translocase subunit SecA n=1 Tax=Bacilliculturomica massiliensis TaxID=1917867 RepID=UPI001030CA82|nr:hypothetical protein [Bacilliculturomica massiliensis]